MVPTITMLFAAILAQAVAVQSLTNPLEIESFKFFDSVTGGEICGSKVLERERGRRRWSRWSRGSSAGISSGSIYVQE
jgi:hypothetical protein